MTTFNHPEPPNTTAFPIARAGYPFIGALAFTTAVFALLGVTVAALVALVSTFFVCFFFPGPRPGHPAAFRCRGLTGRRPDRVGRDGRRIPFCQCGVFEGKHFHVDL